MNTIQGTVNLVTEKTLDGGKGTVYNFKLEDGQWFGMGFKKPLFGKGDFIEFAYTMRGQYKNADPDSVVVKDTAPVPAATPAAVPAAKTDWDTKDKRITMLACRKDAIELTKIAVEVGAVKFGARAKFDAVVEHVNNLSSDLFYNIYGEEFPLNERALPADAEVLNDEE